LLIEQFNGRNKEVILKKYGIDSMDFYNTYKTTMKNSLQFENMCESESFDNGKETSRFGILYWDCELISVYLPSIIENANLIDITSDELRRLYHMNPQRLSKDYTGVTDYWWLILAMNSYSSVYEFKNFTSPILFPNIHYTDNLITIIERTKN
jgi:hypothetical protein